MIRSFASSGEKLDCVSRALRRSARASSSARPRRSGTSTPTLSSPAVVGESLAVIGPEVATAIAVPRTEPSTPERGELLDGAGDPPALVEARDLGLATDRQVRIEGADRGPRGLRARLLLETERANQRKRLEGRVDDLAELEWRPISRYRGRRTGASLCERQRRHEYRHGQRQRVPPFRRARPDRSPHCGSESGAGGNRFS